MSEDELWLNLLSGRSIDARLVRPADYDEALAIILGTPRRGAHV